MGRDIIIFFILVCLTATLSAQPIRHRYPPPVTFDKNTSLKTKTHSLSAVIEDTSTGAVWGPVIKLSTDDPWPSGGNYTPRLATQGDTVHCIWFGGSYRLPYRRSTNGGLNWEDTRELLTDSLRFSSVGGSIFTNNRNILYLFFAGSDTDMTASNGHVYYMRSSDRGTTWSVFMPANSDTSGAFWSPSVRGDTLALVYVPHINDMSQWPRITRSTNSGINWTKNPIDMPSSASNQLRVALTPGLLNLFHVGQRWFPNPEIVLQRSLDLADSWIDSIALSPVDGNGSDMPEVASYERFGTGDTGEITKLGVMWRGEEFTGVWFSAGMALRLSYDNGKTWQPMQIVSDTPRGCFHSLAIRENVVAVSWQDELGDWGPFRVKARVSYDCGNTWAKAFNLTSEMAYAGVPSVSLSKSAIHVTWEERINNKWNIYYRRGELLQTTPLISPSFLDFDTLAVGCSSQEVITVKNFHCDQLYLSAYLTNEQEFSISPDIVIVPPHDSVSLIIRFAPLSAGDKSGKIILTYNQSVDPDTILISATSVGTGSETVITDSFGIGWNLISLPVETPCPYNLPGTYIYQGGYYPTDTLLFGRGYWNKLKKSEISFAGTTVLEDTISVAAQWNIIGSISSPIAVSDIQSVPGGVITSNFHGYNRTNYFIADTIYPGNGYWVKVSQDASLILSSSFKGNSVNSIRISQTNEPPPPPPEVEISNPIPTKSTQIPTEFALEQNYPNPFNPSTNFTFRLKLPGFTTLKVYDMFGREVAALINKNMQAGEHEVEWDVEGLSSGVYFYRLQTQMFTNTKKLLIVR